MPFSCHAHQPLCQYCQSAIMTYHSSDQKVLEVWLPKKKVSEAKHAFQSFRKFFGLSKTQKLIFSKKYWILWFVWTLGLVSIVALVTQVPSDLLRQFIQPKIGSCALWVVSFASFVFLVCMKLIKHLTTLPKISITNIYIAVFFSILAISKSN